MDQPAIQPADDSMKTKDQPECKDLIINIPPKPKEPPRWPDCCIYRVPKRLRELRKRAYTPRLVSIGPFHYYMRKNQSFKDMEQQKVRYFWNFCERTGKSNKYDHLACIKDHLVSIIQKNEDKIRHCYSEDFRLSPEEFVAMILLDAVFILELFWRKYEKLKAHEKNSKNSEAHEKYSENSKAFEEDYILSQPCMERGIQHDLLLLENQLPFFVLEQLYQNGDNTKEPSLRKLSCGFFGDLYRSWRPESKKSCFNDLKGGFFCQTETEKPKNDEALKHITDLDNRFESIEVKHFTDLVRYFFCLTKTEKPKPNCGRELVRSFCCPQKKNKRNNKHLHGTATKLDEAGLKLTKPDSERELLQIQFPENECLERCPWLNLSWLLSWLPCPTSIDCLERHVQRRLEVPPLLLDDKTEGLFRNLMALEQCHYPSKTDICDYIVLLDDLITTKEDVRLLVEKEIIVNELGSSTAVTKLVNNLALEIEESGTRYADLCGKLNEYYKSRWNRLVGILTRTYFSDFFKGTATVVGIIVLVLTLWNFQRIIRLSARKN